MDSFSTIKIKIATANQFRAFSKKLFKTHSEALSTMLLFFENNEISPKESLGPSARTLENLIKRRFNSIVAILKSMETQGITPTKTMMELLFEHVPEQQRASPNKKTNESKNIIDDQLFEDAFKAIEFQKEVTTLTHNNASLKQDIQRILSHIEVQKSSFGKTRLLLQVDPSEVDQLKQLYL